jgi:hypothetical protein
MHHRNGSTELGASQPDAFACHRTSLTKLVDPTGAEPADRVQGPPRCGGRGDLPEQIRLLPQHPQIGDRLTTVGQHHRQITENPARVVPRSTPPTPTGDLGEAVVQAGHRSQITQQPRPGMRDDTRPSAVTVIFGRDVIACTYGVPLYLKILVPQQDQDPKQDRHFRAFITVSHGY